MFINQIELFSSRYDFDDKLSDPVTTPNKTLCKSWKYWKLPFNCKFTVYNNVSSAVIPLTIPVQLPIHNFTNFDISGGPENSTEQMALTLTMKTGDYYNCTWTIHDVTKKTVSLSYPEKPVIFHRFATFGTYGVDISCKNRLYNASASIKVTHYFYIHLDI